VESAEAQIPFATCAEPAPGCADDVRVIQQVIEELPTAHGARGAQPDIRRVHSAENFVAASLQRFANEFGVGEIEFNELSRLLFAVLTVDRFGAALSDVGNAVEFR